MLLWSFFETSCSEQCLFHNECFLPTFALHSVCFVNYVLSLPVFLPFSCHLHIEVLTFQALLFSPLYRQHRADLQCFLIVLWTSVPNKLLASSN